MVEILCQTASLVVNKPTFYKKCFGKWDLAKNSRLTKQFIENSLIVIGTRE